MPGKNLEYARVIGEKVRAARHQRQVSLRELAEKANTSASMLSQIETGKAFPSVRSIYNIASALALPIDYFFPDQNTTGSTQPEQNSHDVGEMTASEMREATLNDKIKAPTLEAVPLPSAMTYVLHAIARPTIMLKGDVMWSRLTAAAEPQIEFLEITYACGATSGEYLSHHEGREFGLILEGELVVQLGFKEFTLQTGDSIVFDSTTPHRLENKSSKPMRALWVVWNYV
jgi:transcriptional regulator with XRE-family HTH domain/quercetin dioxygenase-like cupin family protein